VGEKGRKRVRRIREGEKEGEPIKKKDKEDGLGYILDLQRRRIEIHCCRGLSHNGLFILFYFCCCLILVIIRKQNDYRFFIFICLINCVNG